MLTSSAPKCGTLLTKSFLIPINSKQQNIDVHNKPQLFILLWAQTPP